MAAHNLYMRSAGVPVIIIDVVKACTRFDLLPLDTVNPLPHFPRSPNDISFKLLLLQLSAVMVRCCRLCPLLRNYAAPLLNEPTRCLLLQPN